MKWSNFYRGKWKTQKAAGTERFIDQCRCPGFRVFHEKLQGSQKNHIFLLNNGLSLSLSLMPTMYLTKVAASYLDCMVFYSWFVCHSCTIFGGITKSAT